MTAADFRKTALSFPEAVESSHVGHPDFRVRRKIFATLGYPDDSRGVLMLTPDDQQNAIGRHPEAFSPVKGAWGRRGCTTVELSAIGSDAIRPWMELAWRKVAPKALKK
jgi:hypothetical protein